jgi:hypothetical protein
MIISVACSRGVAMMVDMEATILGITDDVTVCECCGRDDLKRTVAISFDGAAAVYYGTTCAARSIKTTAADIRASARRAMDAKIAAERAERDAKFRAEDALWQSFLDSRSPGRDRFSQIESLGGYAAARAAYEAA